MAQTIIVNMVCHAPLTLSASLGLHSTQATWPPCVCAGAQMGKALPQGQLAVPCCAEEQGSSSMTGPRPRAQALGCCIGRSMHTSFVATRVHIWSPVSVEGCRIDVMVRLP